MNSLLKLVVPIARAEQTVTEQNQWHSKKRINKPLLKAVLFRGCSKALLETSEKTKFNVVKARQAARVVAYVTRCVITCS